LPIGGVDARDRVVGRFRRDLIRAARQLEREISRLAGEFLGREAQAAEIARLTVALRDVRDALDRSGYKTAVDRLLQGRSRLARMVREEMEKLTGSRLAFARPALEAFQAISEADFVALEGLGDEIVAEVHRGLMRAVITGEPFETWAERLKVPTHYATTYARTSTVRLHRFMQKRMDDEVGVKKWRYVGPDDDVTRPFCQRIVRQSRKGKTWTEKQIDKLDNSREGGGAGDGPGSARIQGGGWNCRHMWEPVLLED
jgi:hypothetical protein